MSVRYGGNGSVPSVYALLILWVLVFFNALGFFTVDQAN